MANHTIDVTCAACGRNWDGRAEDPKTCTPYQVKVDNIQKSKENGARLHLAHGERCFCGSTEVYMGSFYSPQTAPMPYYPAPLNEG